VIQALADLPDDIRLVIVGGAAQGGTADQLHWVGKSSDFNRGSAL
jgi:hypothetical protein